MRAATPSPRSGCGRFGWMIFCSPASGATSIAIQPAGMPRRRTVEKTNRRQWDVGKGRFQRRSNLLSARQTEQMHSPGNLEFVEDVLRMGLDRHVADAEPATDLLVGHAATHPRGDLELTRRELRTAIIASFNRGLLCGKQILVCLRNEFPCRPQFARLNGSDGAQDVLR